MRTHEVDHDLQRIFTKDRIRVENKQVLTRRLPQGKIIRFAKSDILPERTEFDLRKLPDHQLRRAISRCIVNNKDLCFEAACFERFA